MNKEIKKILLSGTVIPAHPLVLKQNLQLDEYRQRRLTRYYLASGAGGLAVGVHTTQFDIRKPEVGLLEPVLRLAAEEIENTKSGKPIIKIAGICGPTEQAIKEAQLAKEYGYHLGLVSLGGLNDHSEEELIRHIEKITTVIPVFGFYLQPAVGGRILSFPFWKRMAELPGVYAIKTAPFDRYQTLDVVRAVCASSRREKIALYTGNDDNVVSDMLTTYRFNTGGMQVEKSFSGGLLGHWSVWTKRVVTLFNQIKACKEEHYEGIQELLIRGNAVTDMNAALFDPQHHFRGSIAGIHEVLRRQGLMEGLWCLDPEEKLSPGQKQEIGRVLRQYPDLTDDDFVEEFLKKDKEKYG